MKNLDFLELMKKSLVSTILLFVLGSFLLALLESNPGFIVYLAMISFVPAFLIVLVYAVIEITLFTSWFPNALLRLAFSYFSAIVIFFVIVLIDLCISYPITFKYSCSQMYFFLIVALSGITAYFITERIWYRVTHKR